MYEYKEKYSLDFTNMKSRQYFHDIIAKEFDFPDYYGCNWDAFWDCITDLILSHKGLNIEIMGLNKIYSRYQKDVDVFIELLKDLKHIYNDKFKDSTKIIIHNGDSIFELN